MLISPKYCKVKSYHDDDPQEEEEDVDEDSDDDDFSHNTIDGDNNEDLGVHVVG